uniref:DUF2846 domain-containing protein n=1 Tax=Rhabditophanes sp. KR3021 TaxID=114890 RepID=A0AC35TPA7_9BILA
MDQLVNKGKSEVSPLSNDNTGNSNKFIGQVKFVTFHSGDWLEIYTDFHVKPSLFTLDNKKLISKNVRTIPPSRNGTKYTAYIITIPVPGVHAFYSPAPYLAYVVGRQGNRIEGGMVEDKIKY